MEKKTYQLFVKTCIYILKLCDVFYMGLSLIYRPIALTNPFSGRSGRGRVSGANWSKDDIASYIKNNRKVKTDNVYIKSPIYEFILTPQAINGIRKYNSKNEFTDFDLIWYGKDGKKNLGTRCYSNFLNEHGATMNATWTCYKTGVTSFYSCADKDPNMDKKLLKNKLK